MFESSSPQNNNPNVFTKDARPIVDFSIENRKVLNAREKRQIKSVEKNPIANKGNKNPRAAIAAVKTAVKPLKVTRVVDGYFNLMHLESSELEKKYDLQLVAIVFGHFGAFILNRKEMNKIQSRFILMSVNRKHRQLS